MTGEKVDFDLILNELKWNGKYQIIQISLFLLSSIPVAFSVMSIIFIGYHNPSQCNEVNSTSVFFDYGINISSTNISYGECDITISSHLTEDQHLPCVAGYQYTKPKDSSLNSEWDLVCGKESMSDLLQTLYTIGTGIGSVVFTILADRKGRKPVNCIAGIAFLVLGCVSGYAPNYTSFAVFRVLQGAAQMGMSLTCTILYLEIVPTSQRSTMGVLGTLLWALSMVLYAGVAYLMSGLSWRLHQLIIALTASYYLLMPWLSEESLRWMAAKNREQQLERTLIKASHTNGQDKVAVLDLLHSSHIIPCQTDDVDEFTEDAAHHDIAEEKKLFLDKRILLVSVIVWFIWVTDSMSYYALSLTSTEFHTDKYVGFCLSALMEVLSAPAYWLTVDRFGRKRSCLCFHLLAGLSLILSAICQHLSGMYDLQAAVMVFTLLGKFAVSTSYAIVWFYTPEMFPTTTRNFSLGMASLFARVGGIFAPFSRTLHRHYPWSIGAVIGSFCLAVSFLVKYLPETANQELPQTVSHMQRLLDNKTFTRATTPSSQEHEEKESSLLKCINRTSPRREN